MVTNIASRSVAISWLDPEYPRYYVFSNFLIKLKKENFSILNITTGRVNEYILHNLTSDTAYEISLAAGTRIGNVFGDVATTTFETLPERGEYWKLIQESLLCFFFPLSALLLFFYKAISTQVG
jgi:hypothetical protein